jgi:hypothetical protein
MSNAQNLIDYIAYELLTEQEVILAFIKWLPDDEIGKLIRANDWIFNLEPDDSMDGDHDSAMTSAGFGTDEDYGYYGDNE